MRIDGTTGNQSSLASNSANANRTSTPDAVADAFAANQAASAGNYQPASDLKPFLDNLDRIPLVRQEVLGEVAKQLSGGELDTPKARQQTVESILGAGPGHD